MPDTSAKQPDPRFFLGWSAPALPAAADWLLEQAATSGGADLSDFLVVVPGGRAQRRLRELLAERAVGRALVPPTVVTLGALAGHLMLREIDGFPGGVVDEAEAVLTRAAVLRELEEGLIVKLSPQPPERDDWPGWWSLARQLGEVADELGAAMLLPHEVPGKCVGLADDGRWEAVAQADRRYHAVLAERGRLDPHAARRLAIERGVISTERRIVLVATSDLMPVHRQMLRVVSDRVTPLVFAPIEHAAGFDPLGGLVEPCWRDRHLPIDDDRLRFVDRPDDQAGAVLRAIEGWSKDGSTSADQITVGVAGKELLGTVQRALELAGLPARSATGQPVARSRPALLLQALSGFANSRRFDDLATLLRHPDVEAYVRQDEATAALGVASWLELLDRYATDHLHGRVTGVWLGKPERAERMKAVYDVVLALLPGPGLPGVRRLDAWARPIGEALGKIYGGRKLNRFTKDDRPVVQALVEIGKALEELNTLDASAQPDTTFTQAVRFVLDRVGGRPIAEPGGTAAVELVGYLELLLDDAPRLAIVGMNEGAVPEPMRVNALLPDAARRELGLAGDEHRLVRDKLALMAMLHCRGGVELVAGRRSVDGDPLMPSRLLLSADDKALTARVARFFEEQPQAQPAPMLLTPARHDRFLIPYPTLPHEAIVALRVTAFRDYLACPYRFYLKHVLKLKIYDDREVELSAASFGTLAHETLKLLGQPQLQAVTDRGVIFDHLSMELDRRFAAKLGPEPPAAARLQCEQLRYRLEFAANAHAEIVRDGWRVEHAEVQREAVIEVDGRPFTITGMIDRIDQHADGGFRILDYKTGDTARKPEQTHRKRADTAGNTANEADAEGKQWVDLQLPLYVDLAAGLGVSREVELGYFNLPKKAKETGWAGAAWDAALLAEAAAVRDGVIRNLRAGVFWPPALEPPRFEDGLGGLVADHAAGRAGIVARSASAAGGGQADGD